MNGRNHWRVAATAGIPPEDILAVRDWQNSGRLNAADKAILAATDECLAGKSISDAVWAEVAKHVTDPGQQVEFVVAMGNWLMFSMLFRNLRIPLAEGVAVWPPDGQASPAATAGARPGETPFVGFAQQPRHAPRPRGLALTVRDQILADLDLDMVEAAPLAVHRDRVVAVIGDRVGLVGADYQIALGAQAGRA